MQKAGAQTRAGQYDVNRQNYGRNLAVAGMTAPVLTQTGGTSSGQTIQSQSPLGTVAQIGAAAAPMSL